jgi:hypothetical protein
VVAAKRGDAGVKFAIEALEGAFAFKNTFADNGTVNERRVRRLDLFDS